MKTIIFFTTLLIFLHATTYHLIGTEAKVGLTDAVLDEDGNALTSDNPYYVLPSIPGPGGLISGQLGGEECRFGVSQELRGAGLPVGFFQIDSIPGGAIRESTYTNIMFPPSFACNSSGVWRVAVEDHSTGHFLIVTDGVAVTGNAYNWFWIEKVEGGEGNHYKFRQCGQPEGCLRCPVTCEDIDFVKDGAAMGFLALAETSYAFKFRRYESHAERY